MSAKPRGEALGAIREKMQALYQIGAVDRETMNDIEAAYLIESRPGTRYSNPVLLMAAPIGETLVGVVVSGGGSMFN